MYAGNLVLLPNYTESLTTCKVGILLWELSPDGDDGDAYKQDAPTNLND